MNRVKHTRQLLWLLLLLPAIAFGRTDLMPLEEVRPGARGIWKTAVEGTAVESFELEILGTAPNFIGPKEPIVLAKVIDPDNILSGPVAGMSGSPVFIDGQLIGAYAYGYTWPKEQAIIGITPIERMLPLLDDDVPGGRAESGRSAWLPARQAQPEANPSRDAGGLEPLPTPLSVAGISPATWAVFRPKLERWGLEPMRAPSGTVELPEAFRFESGSPMAAVLMTGDFSAAAAGTMTWTDGENVLGFGHSFLQFGGVEVPFGGAHIYTVVRNLQRSFKLSQPGPVVGTLHTDRLPGVAGRIGPVPEMTRMEIRLNTALDTERVFRAEIYRHPEILPVLSAMALFESLTQLYEAELEQTIRVRTVVRSDLLEPIASETTVSGMGAAPQAALEFLDLFDRFLNNPIEEVTAEAIDVEVEVIDRVQWRRLEAVQLDRKRLRPGETVELHLRLRGYRDEEQSLRIPVTIPESVQGGRSLTIRIADAQTVDRLQQPRGTPRSLEALAERWRSRRGMGSLYVLLVEDRRGIQLGDQTLADPPPSVLARLGADPAPADRIRLEQRVIEEIEVPLEGIFMGDTSVELELETRPSASPAPASSRSTRF